MERKINIKHLRNLVEQIMRELEEDSELDISITEFENDEKGINQGKKPRYSVDYVYTEGDSQIQFSGSLIPFHTGRDFEYEFEPSWFIDAESEKYYDKNWEKVEEQILDKFYKKGI